MGKWNRQNGEIRRDAKARGDKYFDTGKPCKYDHASKRYVSTGSCVECDYLRHKAFHASNPSKKSEYHYARKDEANAYSRAYVRKHRDRLSERSKAIYYADVETARAKAREWSRAGRRNNPIKVRAREQARKKRVKQATPPYANMSVINDIYALRPKCYHVDHVVPLKGSIKGTRKQVICGLHHEGNLQYLPGAQNSAKYNYWSEAGSRDSCAIVPFSWEHFLVISEQA